MDDTAFKKFVSYCGMMTSDYDNEVLTAAKKATRMLLDNKITWEEILCGKPRIQPSPTKWKAQPTPPEPPKKKSSGAVWGGKYSRESNALPHQKMASWMIDYGNFLGGLDKDERKFVFTMQDTIEPTKDQLVTMHYLYCKCGGQ